VHKGGTVCTAVEATLYVGFQGLPAAYSRPRSNLATTYHKYLAIGGNVPMSVWQLFAVWQRGGWMNWNRWLTRAV